MLSSIGSSLINMVAHKTGQVLGLSILPPVCQDCSLEMHLVSMIGYAKSRMKAAMLATGLEYKIVVNSLCKSQTILATIRSRVSRGNHTIHERPSSTVIQTSDHPSYHHQQHAFDCRLRRFWLHRRYVSASKHHIHFKSDFSFKHRMSEPSDKPTRTGL